MKSDLFLCPYTKKPASSAGCFCYFFTLTITATALWWVKVKIKTNYITFHNKLYYTYLFCVVNNNPRNGLQKKPPEQDKSPIPAAINKLLTPVLNIPNIEIKQFNIF